MRFIFFTTALLSLAFLLPPTPALGLTLAEELQQQTGALTGAEGAGLGRAEDPRLVAARLIKQALGLVGILFITYTVYAGYLILTSHGEEEKMMKGEKTLRTAVIGVVITLSAYSISAFVTRNLLRATTQPQPLDEAGVFEGRFEVESDQFNQCAQGRGDPVVCGR